VVASTYTNREGADVLTLCGEEESELRAQIRTLLLLFLVCAACGAARTAPGHAGEIGQAGGNRDRIDQSTQLLVVTTPGWDEVNGKLWRYERKRAGVRWRQVGEPIPVVVGQKGLGWGIGLAPIGIRSGADPVKREGDRKSPAGIFALGTSFGFSAAPPSGWKVPYLALSPAIECVDDVHSKFYNRVVDRGTVTPDWNSSEHMRAVGEYYRWGMVIDQNAGSQPEGGSCVFLHIRGGDGGGTEGCTAMAKPQIESILGWLRSEAHPLLIQMPLQQYRQVEKDLHLPVLQ
jgi:D-alanyl-D-alanine dipeptidase